MKIDRVSATFSRTKQIVQYEPVKSCVTLEAALEDGDNTALCAKSLLNEAKILVNADIASMQTRGGEKAPIPGYTKKDNRPF